MYLAARAQRAPGKEAERRHHFRERSPRALEDQAAADGDEPHAVARGLSGLGLPVLAEMGEEISAGWRRFGLGVAVGRRSVVADRARTDEDTRRRRRFLDCHGQAAGREDAAVAQLRLALRRPAFLADRRAGKVDHRLGAVDRGRPRSGLSVRFPADAGDAGHAGARLVTRFTGRQPARQHADVVAVLGIRLGKRASEEPGTAGDHDLHR